MWRSIGEFSEVARQRPRELTRRFELGLIHASTIARPPMAPSGWRRPPDAGAMITIVIRANLSGNPIPRKAEATQLVEGRRFGKLYETVGGALHESVQGRA